MLADESLGESDQLRVGGSMASAVGSGSDTSDSTAAAGDPVKLKDEPSSMSAGERSPTEPGLEATGSDEDRHEPKDSSGDIVEGSGTLTEKAEGEESARADSLMQELGESDPEQDDEKLSTGSARPAATSATAEDATTGPLEAERDPSSRDSELAADRDSAGSSDKAAKPSNSETAGSTASTAEVELAAGDEGAEVLKAISTDGSSRGSGSMRSGEGEGDTAGTQSDTYGQTDKADWDVQEEPYMMSGLDDENEEWWADEAWFEEPFEEDALLESSDSSAAIGR